MSVLAANCNEMIPISKQKQQCRNDLISIWAEKNTYIYFTGYTSIFFRFNVRYYYGIEAAATSPQKRLFKTLCRQIQTHSRRATCNNFEN